MQHRQTQNQPNTSTNFNSISQWVLLSCYDDESVSDLTGSWASELLFLSSEIEKLSSIVLTFSDVSSLAGSIWTLIFSSTLPCNSSYLSALKLGSFDCAFWVRFFTFIGSFIVLFVESVETSFFSSLIWLIGTLLIGKLNGYFVLYKTESFAM